MKKINVLFFIVCLPFLAHAQKWHRYSDSIYKIISVKHDKKELDNANRFVELADIDIKKNNALKDTIYADYLYLKGVVKYQIGQFTSQPFEESIFIWNHCSKINYLKLSKVHYFLADGFNLTKDYSKAYENYEKCYLINKQFNLKNNIYFSNSVYCLSVIDYQENFNFKKAELYANEYILINKETAYLNFDFNYAYAFRWKDDSKGYENVLLDFNNNYENNNLNNKELYFQINYLLFDYYRKQIFYDKQNKNDELIKYGEKAIEIQNKLNKKNDDILQQMYLELALSYSNKNDEVNKKRYNDLLKKRIFNE